MEYFHHMEHFIFVCEDLGLTSTEPAMTVENKTKTVPLHVLILFVLI